MIQRGRLGENVSVEREREREYWIAFPMSPGDLS